ncbi:hypothetical protein C8R43DRAFT_976042 [Mycena crocata]|nr:hypothetical protein C8R43DRAFT_976042 [Mycena crocata]
MSSNGETSPLLGPRTTPTVPSNVRKPKFTWLIPVVVLASICRGISMFARYQYYQDAYCPDRDPRYGYHCGWFTTWVELPGLTVRMQMWPMFASFVVSFISVGWWSELGDRRGRKVVLFCTILGAMLMDLIYLTVAHVPSLRQDPRDSLSLALIIEGLLGGFATYNGVAHAYAFDVAPTPLSRPVLFATLDALSFIGFVFGAMLGNLTTTSLAYTLSVVFALFNLGFIYTLLPESLKHQDAARSTLPQRSALKSIVSPIAIFFRGASSRKHLPLFALAVYVYSLTTGMDAALPTYTERYLPGLPRWIALTFPRIETLGTLLCVVPAVAWVFQRTHRTSSPSRTQGTSSPARVGMQFATSLAQNSVLVAAISAMGVLVFCSGERSQVLYILFTSLYPLSAGAGPALYALGAAYFLALGRGDEIGSLFGALAVWGAGAQYFSYFVYSGAIPFFLSAFFLIVTLALLLRDGPAVEDAEDSGVDDAPPVPVGISAEGDSAAVGESPHV